ncbi:MAG: MetQ/NlpA family ABC transporter substrate-binding protein [Lachnospirales bacterium]
MKKLVRSILALTIGATFFVGCGTKAPEETQDPVQSEVTEDSGSTENSEGSEVSSDLVELTIGATAVPHGEILDYVKADLLTQGIDLQVVEFSEYAIINPSTTDGSLDGNFFQHTPFLDDYNENTGSDLAIIGPVHIEPLGVYSETLTEISSLIEGSKVAIPNDATNESRALKLLADSGLITLDPDKKEGLTPIDIVDNSLNLEFIELEAAQLPRNLTEVDIAVINTNFAVEAGLNPMEDALVIESSDSPYANILVANQENADNEAMAKLYKALTSEAVREFLVSEYNGAIVPAF